MPGTDMVGSGGAGAAAVDAAGRGGIPGEGSRRSAGGQEGDGLPTVGRVVRAGAAGGVSIDVREVP
ncbi:MAG: hypothetical protein HYX76_09840 [Acidobacteria bacterium]|nr:hypothetical protein [Acidobacteriota bacterium]